MNKVKGLAKPKIMVLYCVKLLTSFVKMRFQRYADISNVFIPLRK